MTLIQFKGKHGEVLGGGLIKSFAADTRTPLCTYADKGLCIANTNPTVLDSNGCAEINLGPYPYNIEVWSINGDLVKVYANVKEIPTQNPIQVAL